jgi:hypothetical protein
VPWGSGIQVTTSVHDLKLADSVDISDFELRVAYSKSNSLDRIADSELMLGVRS